MLTNQSFWKAPHRVAFAVMAVTLLFVGSSGGGANASERLNIAFINVSKPPAFWSRVAEMMKDAANDLEIDLTIYESHGDQAKMISLAQKVGALPRKPDALIVVNERQAGGPMIEAAAKANIPVFLIFSVFAGKDARYYGRPRQKIPQWIGSLRPSHEDAGYAIAHALVKHGKKQFGMKLRMIAIGGNGVTLAATDRETGMRRALKESGGVDLVALERAEWRRDMARTQTLRLLRLQKDIRLIWTANDDMALGATDAVNAAGLVPGKDILIGGLNWSKIGLAKVRNRERAVNVGGHYMGGAWALVMLFDYFHGVDFADEDVEMVFNMGTFDGSNLPATSKLKFKDIDFRKFSKVLNPELKKYRFNIDAIVDEILDHKSQ